MNPFGGDPRKLMKQMQQMQERMQNEIAELRIDASAGGGMVRVVMSGDKQIQGLTIDRQAVNPDDIEMLQDLVMAAINEATRKVDEAIQSKVGSLTAGLKIPGLG